MYRNEGVLRDKTYKTNNHEMTTREAAEQDFSSLHVRLDERIQSLATRTETPPEGEVGTQTIDTINVLKNGRIRVKAAVAELQDMDEDTWEEKREEYNELYNKVNQSVVNL